MKKYRIDLFRKNIKISETTEMTNIQREYFDRLNDAIGWGLENQENDEPVWLLERIGRTIHYEPVMDITKLPRSSF